MIYVGGVPFVRDSSSSQGSDFIIALLEHPHLASASCSFGAIPERKFSVSEESDLEITTQRKCVYVFQREYAITDPALVDIVGTDEATTCVGIVIRNCRSGMTSVAHIDSPEVVDIGITQMMSLLVDPDDDAFMDVHLVGAFEDPALKHARWAGYSLSVCTEIVKTLEKSTVNFNLQMFHVLKHNTRLDSEGNARPIFNGFLVETSSGSIVPATFDGSTRCPDEIVRRIRVSAAFEDPTWSGRLLDTYETETDRFVIAPCSWTMELLQYALMTQKLSDLEILSTFSTSPTAEGPDFVANQRRVSEYLIEHPDWRETFPSKQPCVFERIANGCWRKC